LVVEPANMPLVNTQTVSHPVPEVTTSQCNGFRAIEDLDRTRIRIISYQDLIYQDLIFPS